MESRKIVARTIIYIIALFFLVLALLTALVGSYARVEIKIGKVNVTLAQKDNKLKHETNQLIQRNDDKKVKNCKIQEDS